MLYSHGSCFWHTFSYNSIQHLENQFISLLNLHDINHITNENIKSNNINVTLIEAQNAVGGRTRAIQVNNDTIVDLGASWIHMPVNNPVIHFVQTYGKMESNVHTEFLSLPFEENSIVYKMSKLTKHELEISN